MIQAQLIILPGWTGSKETWKDFLDIAKKEISDVQVIELPCFGEEPCPDTAWGIDSYADFVHKKLSVIPNQEGRKRILMGHSFGGQVAVELLGNRHKDEKIDALILAAAAVVRPRRLLKRIVLGLIAKVAKPILVAFKPLRLILHRFDIEGDYHKTDQGVEREIFKKVIRQDKRSLLPNIKQRTLLVWGTKDGQTPVLDVKKIQKLLPNSKAEILEGATHGLHHQTRTQLLEKITKFISSV